MKKLYLAALLSLAAAQSLAQLAYNASSSTITQGTYNDVGTNGSAITLSISGAPMTRDDDNSAVQSIGFPFYYNGAYYSQFVLNTNGFIRLGNRAAAEDTYDPLDIHADSNLIYAFGYDLDGSDSTEWRVFTTGVMGSRICTIQYKNVRDWTSSTGQYKAVNFQIKLWEGSNKIQFVYGGFNPTAAPVDIIPANVGIKGNDPSSSVNAMKASIARWDSAVFIDGNYSFTGNKFNNRNTLLPTPGVTITFNYVTLPGNDASVLNVYTLGKLPMGLGSPYSVTATVKNTGANALTNLPVTLSITGANTFTNTKHISLNPGNTTVVSFDGFSPATTGNCNVVVSVPLDDVNTNNSKQYYSMVTSNTFSYADTSRATAFVGYNTGAGLILTKYKMHGTGKVTQVNVRISDTSLNTGQVVYAVVVDANGTIVAQSDSATLSAADLGTYKSFTINSTPAFTDTSFYAGLAQTPTDTSYGYFPVSTQTEGPPSRSGAYYTLTLGGGTVPTQATTVGRLMIEAVVAQAPSPAINITSVSRHKMCSGDTFSVSYAINNPFNAGNEFFVEMSDSAGSFSSPSTVGSAAIVTGGTIACTLPAQLSNGTNYRLRMRSTNPAITSPVALDMLSIYNKPNLGSDVTVNICSGKVDLTRYFNTAGLDTQWSVANPYAVSAGTYMLIASNVAGCVDTAYVNVVGDTAKPVAPVLKDVEGACTVTAPIPVTTDLCSGTIRGTTGDPRTYNVPGTYIIHWTFTDSSGNATMANQNLTVYDSLPVIHTTDVRVNADSGKCAATGITLPSPVTNFNCMVTSATNNHPSTTYPLGETAVIWTIVDNKGRTTYTTQRVIVTAVLPTIRATADTGACSAVVNIGTPFTTSDCSGYTLTSDHPSNVYPIGVTMVTWTLTNTSNSKTYTATQFVNVRAVLPLVKVNADSGSCSASNVKLTSPLISSCGSYTAQNDHGSPTYGPGVNVVTWTLTSSTGVQVITQQYVIVSLPALPLIRVNPDGNSCVATNVSVPAPYGGVCNGYTITSDHPSTAYGLGLTTVNWTITNAAGKVVVVMRQYVLVRDTLKPILVPPPTQTFCSNSNSSYTIPQLQASDNCGILSVTYKTEGATIRSGTGIDASGTFNKGTTWLYWRVTDSSGNVQAAATKVIVKDCPTIAKNEANSTPQVQLGIDEATQPGLRLYPNPTAGKFNAEVKGYKAGKAEITILNEMQGILEKRVVQLTGSTQTIGFDMMNRASGVYFVKVKTAEGVWMEKVVVRR